MPELNSLDYTNIFAILVIILILLFLGRAIINFTRTLFRMIFLIILIGGGIYALWVYLQV